jgi:hypothetical protein
MERGSCAGRDYELLDYRLLPAQCLSPPAHILSLRMMCEQRKLATLWPRTLSVGGADFAMIPAR